ncbi:sensor histidine kinase [Frigidibacter sp.]|uniref:sensor histidine kinase n=1 Tax=Frigidibacter sp. TaxID=2586418 RepID=UPI00273669FE|nr:sensor histidine kinase [Frigidibacter sp.]MDP3340927.1 sensor histidine kinase N-terminal domain-containing protein [Frigidibacter sp.]
MTSIQRRLFVALLTATGLIWLSAALWIQSSTRVELNRVLDNRLAEAARMVGSLVDQDGLQLNAAMALAAPALPGEAAHSYARQLSCQVWGLDGTRLAASSQAPQQALAAVEEGFSEDEVDGLLWRVYTHVDTARGIRVMVGDSVAIRERLLADVVQGLMWPALFILPLLAGAIWLSLRSGLAPLHRIAGLLSQRGAEDLAPLEAPAPREVAPMVAALNGLFARVRAARQREQDFTAYAAHELKTPLAGLKMQAEVARLAPDAKTRDHALAQIRRAVDRSDRLVHQLLDLAAVDQGSDGSAPRPLPRIGAEVLDLTAAAARAARVDLHLHCDDALATLSPPLPDLLVVALRNLVENAVHASPEGARVDLRLTATPTGWQAEVLDEGPGIPTAARPCVTERFYRGSSEGGGSGLGLAIVETAALRLGATFTLTPRLPQGEVARLAFDAR